MATDPYSWAKEYAATSAQRANQMDSDKMQMLLNVFQEEAARQRPYVTMPAELQLAEAKAAIQRRYGTRKKKDDEDDGLDDDTSKGPSDEFGSYSVIGGQRYYTTKEAQAAYDASK